VFGLFDDIKEKIDALMKLAVAGAIAAAAAVVAFFCFAISLFLWVQQNYGTLDAWLALGGLFLLLAIVCGIVMLSLRRRKPVKRRSDAKPREQPSAISRLMQEPAVLLTGLQLARMLGPRVIVPVVLLAAVAGGFLISGRNGNGHRDTHETADAYEQDHGFDAG
jgi:formate hydrogenlyase subunit 3/multisubunit Na+/H+ antiporter MnhD subunit